MILKILTFLIFALNIYNFVVAIMFFIFTNSPSTDCKSSKNSTEDISDFYKRLLMYILSNVICTDLLFIFIVDSFIGTKSFNMENKIFIILLTIISVISLALTSYFSLYFYKQLESSTKVKCTSSNKSYVSILKKLLISSGICSIIIIVFLIIYLLATIFKKTETGGI